MRPSLGFRRPATIRPSVDFPHPDSPTRPSTSPCRTSRRTPSTACTVTGSIDAPSLLAVCSAMSNCLVNRLETFSISMMEVTLQRPLIGCRYGGGHSAHGGPPRLLPAEVRSHRLRLLGDSGDGTCTPQAGAAARASFP